MKPNTQTNHRFWPASLAYALVFICFSAHLLLSQSLKWERVFPGKACGADSSLYSVCFEDSAHAYSVGEDGAAFRSTDGGRTFTGMSIAGKIDLYEVRFISRDHGFACGDLGMLAETTDGGSTWMRRSLVGFETRALYAMEWLNDRIGFIAGGASSVAHGQAAIPDGFILRTTNAGVSWDMVQQDMTSFFWSLDVAGNRIFSTAYSPISQGRIIESTNAGILWNIRINNLPFLPHDISVASDGTTMFGAAVGGNPFDIGAKPRIALYNGTSWSVQPDTLSLEGFAWSVATYIGDSAATGVRMHMVMGLQTGHTVESSDGGLSWPAFVQPSDCALYDMAFRSETRLTGSRQIVGLVAGSGCGLFRRETEEAATGIRIADAQDDINLHSLYPQPVSISRDGTICITLSSRNAIRYTVLDVLGRIVTEGCTSAKPDGPFAYSIKILGLSSQTYVLVLSSNVSVRVKRFVVVP